MAPRITSLPESLSLEAHRQKWLEIGLSTEPADRPTAEAGVRAAYEAAGLPPPAMVVWLESPMAGAVGAAVLARGAQVGDQVEAQVGDQARAQVGAQVRAQAWRAVWGQHDAGWLGFYDVMSALGVRGCERLNGISDVARSAGWWWPFEGAVVLTERPRTLTRDAQGRLHSQTGPAIVYPDGWGVHVWHGTRVPAEWIERPAEVDATLGLTWPDMEQRRALVEILGWPRVLAGLASRDVDTHPTRTGEVLFEVDLPAEPAQRFLRVLCGTGRTFVLRVPPETPTAQAAQDWIWSLPPGGYDPEVRT